MRNKIRYVPWYSVTTLTNIVGGRVDALKIKLLKAFEFLTISQLEEKYQSPLKVGTDMIIPQHLKDSNYDRRLFINNLAALTLIRHIAYKSTPVLINDNDVRLIAGELLDTMDSLDSIITDLVDGMNDLVTEYRYQQQTQQLAVIEADKREHECKKKQLEEETKLLALKKFPDIKPEKSHYGYIFSSPEYMATNLYKIGITDHLANREQSAKTYCPTGNFLHTVETYDARSTERMIHQALKEHNLWHEVSSGNEWFYIPSLDKAIELLDLATNNTSTVYECISSFASKLRVSYITNPISASIQRLAIKDDPGIEPIIVDYVDDVLKQFIDNNITSMSKTNMALLLKKIACSPKYKKKKDRLPMDLETFLSNTNIKGISFSKKQTNGGTTIKVDMCKKKDN